MADPTTKAELLDTMQRGYTAFEALLVPLSAEQLTTPGVNDEWSIKDNLAHIATWQGRMAERLEAIARGEDEAKLEPTITTEEEMHQFNAATFTANRSRPLDEVRANFRASYQRMLAATGVLSESVLFEPGRFAWMKGDPLWKNIGGNSFWHYDEHTAIIEQWLARQAV
jgi:hypothetical protein